VTTRQHPRTGRRIADTVAEAAENITAHDREVLGMPDADDDEATRPLTTKERRALGLDGLDPGTGDVTSVPEAPVLTPPGGLPALDHAPSIALDVTLANLPHGKRCIRAIGSPPEGGFTTAEAHRFATELIQVADMAAKIRQDKGFWD
jgi:hypothetical protein